MKVAIAVLLLAIVAYIAYKLWQCVSSPLQCLKDALSTVAKFFQGTGSLNIFKMGTALAGNTAPGLSKVKPTAAIDVTSPNGQGGDRSGCEWSTDPNVTCGTAPLSIDITCGSSSPGLCGNN
jgi:hypothetical protein